MWPIVTDFACSVVCMSVCHCVQCVGHLNVLIKTVESIEMTFKAVLSRGPKLDGVDVLKCVMRCRSTCRGTLQITMVLYFVSDINHTPGSELIVFTFCETKQVLVLGHRGSYM